MLEYCEGFDTLTTAQITRRYPTAVGYSIASPGKDGTGYRLNNYDTSASLPIPVTARDQYIVGFDFKTSGGAYNPFLKFRNNDTDILALAHVGGYLRINIRGGANQDSAAGVLLADTWMSIQVKLIISATVGQVIIKVNGVTIFNLTNQNTGTSDINKILLGGAGNYQGWSYDNLWILNATGSHSNDFPLGVMRVAAMVPTSDATPNQFTPSTGTDHFALVDDAQSDDDTSYVYSETPGHVERFGISAAPGTIAEVHGAMVWATMRKDDIDAKFARVQATSGSTTVESGDIDVPLTYSEYGLLVPQDPDTNAQFDEAGINALKIGITVQA